MGKGTCKGTDFKIAPLYNTSVSQTVINNILNSQEFINQVTEGVNTIVNQTLSITPFSLVLESGTLRVVDQLYWYYFPEQTGVDLKGNNGRTLIWKQSLYGLFNNAKLVFWTDENNSYDDSGGFPLAKHIDVRIIQSDSIKGADYSVLQSSLSVNAFDRYAFKGEANMTTNRFIQSVDSVFPTITSGFNFAIPNPPLASDVGKSYIVTTAGPASYGAGPWNVGDLIVTNTASLNGYVQIPVSTVNSFLLPGSTLTYTTITTTGVQEISFTPPTNDCILYVHFKSTDPIAVVDTRNDTEIHGLRIDLFF